MSHGVVRGEDWARRIGLAILGITSLMVVAGVVIAAYRGRLIGTTTGYGAIVLPILVLGQFLVLRRNPFAVLIGGPIALLAAFHWLQAVTV